MGIEDITEDEIRGELSELALDLLRERTPRPRYEDGWRTVRQLIDETGLTEPVLRRIVEQKVRAGEYEEVRGTPCYYRKKKVSE